MLRLMTAYVDVRGHWPWHVVVVTHPLRIVLFLMVANVVDRFGDDY